MSVYLKQESIRSEKAAGKGNRNIYYSGARRKALEEISNYSEISYSNSPRRSINSDRNKRNNRYTIVEKYSKIEINTIVTRSKDKIIKNSTCAMTVRNVKSQNNGNYSLKHFKAKETKIKAGSYCKNVARNNNKKFSEIKAEVYSKGVTLPEENLRNNDVENEDDVEEPYRKFKGNIFLSTCYVKDIYRYMLKIENDYTITKNFLEGGQVTPHVRAILIDWIIDIQVLFKLSNESFHLAVYLFDSYLQSNKNITKNNLQLLAITCVSLASKFDHVHSPHLKDLIEATENCCLKRDVIRMEFEILSTVDMRLNKPPITCFLRRYGIITEIDKFHHNCSKFFVDACLINYSTCYYKSSVIAAAATFISLCLKFKIVSPSIWNDDLILYSTYEVKDFLPVIKSLAAFIIELPKRQYSAAIIDKYSLAIFEKVADKIYDLKNIEIIKKCCCKSNRK